MANVILEQVVKQFGKVEVVHGVSLCIESREFIVLVGPSGCGKSTILRMVAGLEKITAGVIRIGDRVVNDIAPKDRDIAMVFQNYALYPHMNVMRTPAIKNRLTLIQPTIRPILVKLQSINTMLAAKTRPTTNPLMPASQAAPSMATSSFSLIGDIIAEEMLDQGKWIVGKMGSAGLLLKVKGMTIKIDDDEADKLVIGLETNKTVSIKTPGGKRYVFAPSDNGFSVSEIGDDTKFPEGIKLDSEQVSEIIDMINS